MSTETLIQIMLVKKYKNKNNSYKNAKGFNLVQPTILTFTNDRESFYYT